MVTKYENLLFDMFCDTMWSALDIIGYKGDDGFVKEVIDIMDDCLTKQKCRGVGIYVVLDSDHFARIEVECDDRPICERFDRGDVLILYAHLNISIFGIIDMNIYEGEDITIWL